MGQLNIMPFSILKRIPRIQAHVSSMKAIPAPVSSISNVPVSSSVSQLKQSQDTPMGMFDYTKYDKERMEVVGEENAVGEKKVDKAMEMKQGIKDGVRRVGREYRDREGKIIKTK
jgi:hypothetical protein